MSIDNQSKSNRKRAFTLIEMLISITIFGIISVMMTGIVLNMANVSMLLDRRNDFLNELDIGVSALKNEMRNAQKLGICKTIINTNTPKSMYIVKKPVLKSVGASPVTEYYKVSIEEGQLYMILLSADPSQNDICSVSESAKKVFLTSNNIKLQNLAIVVTSDNSSPKNSLIYVSFEACDPESIARKNFNCEDVDAPNYSPYKYLFGISTRNF